ncbi:MAG: Uma2 family endonuclease [Treponema sp.]|nr:Uma2 family endonuclease [Treponema sp.]
MNHPMRRPTGETRHFIYADYKNWELDEGERYELIHGTAYAMAAPNDEHQAIAAELTAQFVVFLRGKPCKVRPAPYDVRLFYAEDESDSTVVQPDISVICGDDKRGPEGGRGAPALIVEILSPSNTSEEYVHKFNLYLEAGVREYWVVSPLHKTVLVFLLQEGAYRGTVFGSTATISATVLEGLTVNLGEVFTH